MTINRKEKILIFVLILFLLVGGTYTLGIMPKNNDKKTAQEELQTVEGDIAKIKKQNAAVSPSEYNRLIEDIRRNEAALKQLTSPSNNLNEELLPSNMPGHQDSVAIAETLYKFFGDLGFNVEISLGRPVTTSTKKVYTISSAYKTDMQTLYKVTDAIARVKSYNLTYLSMTPDGNDVSGTFSMTITYILNE
ncbi:unknown [Clostridium sp. CAG:349]|nr:unknown [Clostridium sp. CAG:349]